MTIDINQDMITIAATAALSATAGFVIGYLVGRKISKNPLKFALKFTTLQIVAILLFVSYNMILVKEPDQLVNLGILAMIGGESLGMLFTRGVDKAIEKAVQKK